VTQFRTRTQSVRTVLGLVLDASCQSLEDEDEYRCAEYEYEYEKEYEYEREALGTGNATAEGAKRDKRMQDKRILSLSHSRVPDVFMNRVTRLGVSAAMPAKRQLCSANRRFHRAVEPADPLGVTQFRTRTQSVRTVLGLVLDASCQSLEDEDEYRCAEYEYEYEYEYEKEYEYEREALGTGNSDSRGRQKGQTNAGQANTLAEPVPDMNRNSGSR
jgi:hypothetical protein